MAHQHALGDLVMAKASVLGQVSATSDQVRLLINHHYGHAVAMGARYYNLASVAAGHNGLVRFPSVAISPDHIDNALAKAGGNNLPGAIQSLVLGGARHTIIAASAMDPTSTGWDRMPEPGACDFCTSKSGPGGPDFPAHYNCNCIAAPVFKEVVNNGRSKSIRAGLTP